MNRFRKRLLLATYLPVMTLVLLEIGVRLWGYSEQYVYDPIYMPFDETEDIPYVHKPNLMNVRARGLAIISTDSLGLRSITAGDRYGPKEDNEYRVAIVGDSVTFGQGIRKTKDTFSQVLEDTLNQKQSGVRVQVFNYGVSAYSVKEMAATLQHRMSNMELDLVLMAIIPHDFDLSRTVTVDKWGYTANDNMSGFMPKDSIVKRMLRNVHLVYLLRDLRYQWLKRSQNVQYGTSEDNLPDSYRYVEQFGEIAKELKLSYSIVLLPCLEKGFETFGSVREQLERDEIAFVDLSSLRNEFDPDQFRASKFDSGHPSAVVHWRIGEVLAEYILQEQLTTSAATEFK